MTTTEYLAAIALLQGNAADIGYPSAQCYYDILKSNSSALLAEFHFHHAAIAEFLLSPTSHAWACRPSWIALPQNMTSSLYNCPQPDVKRDEYVFFPSARNDIMEVNQRGEGHDSKKPRHQQCADESDSNQYLKPPPKRGEVRLPNGYHPHPFDVICRNDRESVFHSGNDYFLRQVKLRVDRYANAHTRMEKSMIIREIVHAVRANGGRFIRQKCKNNHNVPGERRNDSEQEGNDDAYWEIASKKAADKTGHALRLALSKRSEDF